MGGTQYYYTEPGSIEWILNEGQGHSYPWHLHIQHWTFGLVRRGSVILMLKDGTHCFDVGQSFSIRPYEPHSLTIIPDSSLLVVCMDKERLGQSRGLLSHSALCLGPGEERWLEKIANICDGEAFDTLSVQDYPNFISCVQHVMQKILARPDEFFPLEQMSAYTGYSRWHFLRSFHKATGLTPHVFQSLCRLRLLRSMLRADTAAAEAAVSAGFTDQSHMQRVFKRHHGMTPGAFKKASVRVRTR